MNQMKTSMEVTGDNVYIHTKVPPKGLLKVGDLVLIKPVKKYNRDGLSENEFNKPLPSSIHLFYKYELDYGPYIVTDTCSVPDDVSINVAYRFRSLSTCRVVRMSWSYYIHSNYYTAQSNEYDFVFKILD